MRRVLDYRWPQMLPAIYVDGGKGLLTPRSAQPPIQPGPRPRHCPTSTSPAGCPLLVWRGLASRASSPPGPQPLKADGWRVASSHRRSPPSGRTSQRRDRRQRPQVRSPTSTVGPTWHLRPVCRRQDTLRKLPTKRDLSFALPRRDGRSLNRRRAACTANLMPSTGRPTGTGHRRRSNRR